jgi:hypothetical protein
MFTNSPIPAQPLYAAAPAGNMSDKGNHKKNKKYEEQQLRDAGSSYGNAGKTKNARNQRNDQKYQSPIKHCGYLLSEWLQLNLSTVRQYKGGSKCPIPSVLYFDTDNHVFRILVA